MTLIKLAAQDNQEQSSDAPWLEGLPQQSGAPVRSGQALMPMDDVAPVVAPTSPALRARAEEVVQRARSLNLSTFPVVIAPLFSGWRLYRQGAHYDYVFCNLAEDPLFHDSDRFPIPQQIRRQLRHLNQTGLGREFDLLYVVHEVKKGAVREGEPLNPDLFAPPSPRVMRASKCMGTLGQGAWFSASVPLLIGAGLAGITAGLAAAVAAAPVALLAFAPLGLDPLLLGAIVAPGRPIQTGETAVWFYLSHWCYTDSAKG